jgi:hypothetical protein
MKIKINIQRFTRLREVVKKAFLTPNLPPHILELERLLPIRIGSFLGEISFLLLLVLRESLLRRPKGLLPPYGKGEGGEDKKDLLDLLAELKNASSSDLEFAKSQALKILQDKGKNS